MRRGKRSEWIRIERERVENCLLLCHMCPIITTMHSIPQRLSVRRPSRYREAGGRWVNDPAVQTKVSALSFSLSGRRRIVLASNDWRSQPRQPTVSRPDHPLHPLPRE